MIGSEILAMFNLVIDSKLRRCDVVSFRPVWSRIITLGCKKFIQKLSRDEVQCFRVAGLLEDPPTGSVIV